MIMVTGATNGIGQPSLRCSPAARRSAPSAGIRHRWSAGRSRSRRGRPEPARSLQGCFDGVTAIFLNARAVKTAASRS